MIARLRDEERAFTLVEVLAASIILILGVLGTVSLVDNANETTQRSMGREAATNLARDLVENARLVPYPRATSGAAIVSELQALTGLADTSGEAGWQLQRRNRTFTVSADVCLLDDAKDGLGPHDASFCSNSAPAGTADGNPKDYKRVTVGLTWNHAGRQYQTRQTTLVAPRGTADLPRVTSLRMTSPITADNTTTPPPVITSDVTTARFGVTTSIAPTGVSWLIDGGVKGLASGSGLAWSFDWPITGLADGTYQVGAQPFDASGSSGAATEMTVKLNRRIPPGPTPLYAGFNTIPGTSGQRRVDAEWKANTDKDILGYRMYWQYASSSNVPTGTPTRVCPAADASPPYAKETACSWTMPSPGGSDQVRLNVWVTAVDKDGSTETLREGASSAVVDAYAVNKEPNPPTSITATKPGDGTVVLTWSPPATPDADSGDRILFYRIFRKAGSGATVCPPPLADLIPYDRTPFETGTEGASRRWVDPQPISGTATYAVCAVDTKPVVNGGAVGMKLSLKDTGTTVTYP